MVLGMKGLIQRIKGQNKNKTSEYPDVTTKFFDEYLPSQNHTQATGSIIIIAQKRWGKTLVAAGIFEKMMENPNRQLWLIDCQQIVDIIYKQFPGRVFNTSDLDKIPNGAIIYFDETLVSLSGKRALTKYSRKFGEALAFTSHKQIYVIGCAQTDGMIKDFRDKAEIVILGRLPLFFLESCKEAFIKDLKDELLMLPKDRAYIFANSFEFTAKGRLVGDKRKWCPWFSDELSMNMSEHSLDTDKERKRKEIVKLSEIMKQFMENYKPKEILGSKFLKKLQGDLLMEDLSTYIWLDERNLWANLEAMLLSWACKQKEEKTNSENKKPEYNYNGEDFPTFVKNNLLEVDKDLAEIAYYCLMGLSYQKIYPIAEGLGLTSYQVNTMLHEFMEAGSGGEYTNRAGYFFEKWFANVLGESAIVADPDSHDPDILFNKKAFSCKCYNKTKTSQDFDIEKRFSPEFKYARKNNDTFYAVGYFPNWGLKTGNFIRILEVDPLGPNIINLFRDKEDQFFTDEFLETLKGGDNTGNES